MKKSEMIEALAKETGLTKVDVEKVFNGTFNLFKDELAKGNNVAVAGDRKSTRLNSSHAR